MKFLCAISILFAIAATAGGAATKDAKLRMGMRIGDVLAVKTICGTFGVLQNPLGRDPGGVTKLESSVVDRQVRVYTEFPHSKAVNDRAAVVLENQFVHDLNGVRTDCSAVVPVEEDIIEEVWKRLQDGMRDFRADPGFLGGDAGATTIVVRECVDANTDDLWITRTETVLRLARIDPVWPTVSVDVTTLSDILFDPCKS